MEPIAQVAADLALTPAEVAETTRLIATAEALAGEAAIKLDDLAVLGLANHIASMIRRLKDGESVEGVDAALFEEVPPAFRAMAAKLIGPSFEEAGRPLDPVEVGLVALHFAAAQERIGA